MIGRTISHYKIIEKLGEGGMGVVYKARDLTLERTVALKFLSPGTLENPDSKDRFLREAKAAAGLDHPNVCTVYETGEHDGQAFIAMAYLEGQTIREKTMRGPLDIDEAVDIATQAAAGLQAAHDKRIVHRDIKSANLMVTGEGRVQIMDFGLAQLVDQATDEPVEQIDPEEQTRTIGQIIDITRLTRTGTTLGTPAYMSPEQATQGPTDHRSDIWSLGVVLYEMVTGRLPFASLRGDLQSVLQAILHEDPPPVTAARPGAPAELTPVLAKALAKNPDERYQQAREMAADLQRVVAKKPSRRGLAAVLVAVALFVLALLFDVGGLRQRMATRPAEESIASIAVLPLTNLTGDPEQEYFADGMTEALITNLSKLPGLTVISRTSAMRYKNADKTLPEIARELHVDAVVEGSVMREANRVQISAKLIDASTDRHLWTEGYEREIAGLFALQKELSRAIAIAVRGELEPADEARIAPDYEPNPETHELYLKGMFQLQKMTPEGIQMGMEYLHQAVEKDPADPAAYAGLADGYITIAHGPEPPADSLETARTLIDKAMRLNDELPEVLAAAAFLKGYYDCEFEEAFELLDRAIAVNPNLAIAHYHRAWLYYLFGRMDEAIEAHILAQRLDPLMPLHTVWLGGLYAFDGRYEEAEAEVQKAIEFSPGHPLGHAVLAMVYSQQGQHEAAIAENQKAAAITPFWKWSLGGYYALAGRTEEARQLAAESEALPASPWRAFWLAQTYSLLGDKDQAFRWLNYEHPHAWVPWFRVMPVFEPLRDDARFDELLEKKNLPPLPADYPRLLPRG
jgi:eukaryotic-like serine/threonine-protein kinase